MHPDPYPLDSGILGGAATFLDMDSAAAVDIPCVAAVSGARIHPGNFDYRGCNGGDGGGCHSNYSGGWLYTDTKGDQPVAEATVTVTNDDGTTVTAVAASDGFFSLIGTSQMVGKIPGTYKVCVSKCPDTVCSTSTHVGEDCQTSACHGGDSPRIYLTQRRGSDAGIDATCTTLASGGPKVHNAALDDNQPCRNCHGNIYTGGFVYDGIKSQTTVARATVTVTPAKGAPITMPTGPGGMFYYSGIIPAPYTTCVSKCQKTKCSLASTHTTTDDCRKCHDESNRIYLE
jgi:hypothetical protein